MTIVAGTIFPFGGTSVPSGYLLCDGQAVSRTTYATLFGVIGTTFGPGDGSTTFNLPDLTGGVSPPPTVVLTYLITIEDSIDDGTVTSVGLSTDANWFSVSGSPITTSGTLAMDLATGLTGNQVLATPDGTTGSVGLRALVGDDLPNPTASSKGGVQSLSATGSQWINSISTSGVPGTSQPAFTDISGTVAASQLPNPTASTKGGVQSLAATAGQWIDSISTSGVPGTSQPDFTDISGTVAAAQLPNPTASTKGGVQSLAATTSQWINTISTSGVPSASQPAFTDIAGVAAASQLPNPTTSTKGGVQAITPTTSQWINGISTSGVPSASQPAFTDISGVAAPSQLPNPTASTKGGVQSLAATSSKWINSISTSGVPNATQPAFSDISGTIANGQLPANTKISNVGTVIDGGGFIITTGQKGYIYCPFAGTITAATLIADASGSIVIDVWKAAFNTIPTDANSITASTPPTLSGAQTSQNTTLTGWTTSVNAGDVFGFNVDSVSGIRRIALQLTIQRS